jgi:Ca-activated chloride channel family protein
MPNLRPRVLVPALTLGAVIGACSTIEGGILGDGDAEWERPPFSPPGGDGEAPPEDSWDDSGGSPGGTSGLTGTASDSDPTWPDSTGEDPATTDATTGGDTHMCTPADTGGVCDAQAGVCEAAPEAGESGDSTGGTDGTDPAAPCCEDPDCACDTDDCSNLPCQADAYCDCNCPADPDCGPGVCEGKAGADDRPLAAPVDPAAAAACPDTRDPVVLYMSNDDSNSQASPVLARRAIVEGGVVDPFRVRIHEFLNYYDLSYDNPADVPAQVGVQMRRIDPDTGEFVLLLYAQGKRLDRADRRPISLVFSLDTSGSMDGERLDLLKATMRAAAGNLREGDIVSVVTWNDQQSVELEGHAIAGPDDPTLLGVIDGLQAGGSTDLSAGLITAYELAEQHYAKDRINRVMLISDGGANTGLTDEQLIAEAAADENGEGIYMIGVGVGEAAGYNDLLMDTVTDKGKGAYVFIDRPEEAERSFGELFLQQVEVAARDVQMQLTLPWYFGIKEFHGEEYSADPAEVDPQHLAPNDAMSYHQTIQSCDPRQILTTDRIKARATFEDPISREAMQSEVEVAIGDVVNADATQLYKADVVVGYAQSLIVIGDLVAKGDAAGAHEVAVGMVAWLGTAADKLADKEVAEMQQLMQTYAQRLQQP